LKGVPDRLKDLPDHSNDPPRRFKLAKRKGRPSDSQLVARSTTDMVQERLTFLRVKGIFRRFAKCCGSTTALWRHLNLDGVRWCGAFVKTSMRTLRAQINEVHPQVVKAVLEL
jgi:hypothetical protein